MKFFLLFFLVPLIAPIIISRDHISLSAECGLEFKLLTLPITLNYQYNLKGMLIVSNPKQKQQNLFHLNFHHPKEAKGFIRKATDVVNAAVLQWIISSAGEELQEHPELSLILALKNSLLKSSSLEKDYQTSTYVNKIYKAVIPLVIGGDPRYGAQEIKLTFTYNPRAILSELKRIQFTKKSKNLKEEFKKAFSVKHLLNNLYRADLEGAFNGIKPEAYNKNLEALTKKYAAMSIRRILNILKKNKGIVLWYIMLETSLTEKEISFEEENFIYLGPWRGSDLMYQARNTHGLTSSRNIKK